MTPIENNDQNREIDRVVHYYNKYDVSLELWLFVEQFEFFVFLVE